MGRQNPFIRSLQNAMYRTFPPLKNPMRQLPMNPRDLKRPIRLALLLPEPKFGGCQRQALELARGLSPAHQKYQQAK